MYSVKTALLAMQNTILVSFILNVVAPYHNPKTVYEPHRGSNKGSLGRMAEEQVADFGQPAETRNLAVADAGVTNVQPGGIKNRMK